MYYEIFFKKFIETHTENSQVICIDGVVGVGKSTLGELITKEFGINMFQEPVIDNPLLDKFYYDPHCIIKCNQAKNKNAS